MRDIPDVATTDNYVAVAHAAALTAAGLTVAGFVLGIAAPGPYTGALFVLGLGLWWAVGEFARRHGLGST